MLNTVQPTLKIATLALKITGFFVVEYAMRGKFPVIITAIGFKTTVQTYITFRPFLIHTLFTGQVFSIITFGGVA
jgi:hypothetical protein